MNPDLSYAPQPANVESQPALQNLFSRVIGIWFSPGETFAEVGRAPRVLIPTLVLVLLTGGSNYLLTARYGYENIIRNQMESMVNAGLLPQDKAEEVIQQSTTPSQIAAGKLQSGVGGAIAIIAILLVMAGLFKGFTVMMGMDNRFKQVYSITAYAFLAISLISTVVFLASIYLKDPTDIDLYNPIGSNLGALLPMMVDGLPKFVIGLASYIDVFSIWRIILLAIGYSAVTRKMKTGMAAGFLAALYIIGALIGAAMTYMF